MRRLALLLPVVLLSGITFAAAQDQTGAQSQPAAGEVLYNGIVLPAQWPPKLEAVPSDPVEPWYLKSPPKVIPIDVGRQLFVDDFLIESTSLKRACHQAEAYLGNPLSVEPGASRDVVEGDSGGLFWDYNDSKIKYWHGALRLSYSQDGIHWESPKFDVKPGTNVVVEGHIGCKAIWIDPDPADPNKRYVFIHNVLYDPPGFCRYWYRFSPDGIHWTDRFATDGDCGDRSTAFYNPFRKVWVYSMRMGWVGPRTRKYWEVRDLEKGPYWKSDPTIGAYWWVGADSGDPVRPDVLDGETLVRGFDYERKAGVPCQLYNIDCTAYESLMLGMYTVWHGQPMTEVWPNGKNRAKCNNVCVGFSRDGWSFSRPDRRTIFDMHDSYNENGELSNIQSVCGGVINMGDNLFIYTGRPGTRLSILRRDGFASMSADSQTGELVTRPVTFSGNNLYVNVNCPQGKLRVAVLDEAGKPLKDYDLKDCQPLTADKTLQPVAWKTRGDLSGLAGKPVRFKFELTNGELYSFWVSPDKSGQSRGYSGGPGFTAATDTVGSGNYFASLSQADADEATYHQPTGATSAPQPILWPRGGKYTGGITVKIEMPLFEAANGQTIRYTTDGKDPSEESPAYDKPFTLAKVGETNVKACTFAKGEKPSPIAQGTFVISADTKPPRIFQTLPQTDLPSGTKESTVLVRTGKSAICRYAEKPGVAYDDMTGTMDSREHSMYETRLDLSGGTIHTKSISGLKDGDSKKLYIKARDAYGNTTKDDFVVLLTVNPNLPRPVEVHMQAESAALEAPMAIVADRDAIENKCISTPEREKGSATLDFQVPADGKYVIWARVKGPTDGSDSFFVLMDGAEDIFDMNREDGQPIKDEWKIMPVNARAGGEPFAQNPRIFELKAGKHTLIFRGREPGAFLDWVTITNKIEQK